MPRAALVNAKDAEHARHSAHLVVQTHFRLAEFIKEGMTLGEVDEEVARLLEEFSCKSCFRHYRAGNLPPFPSHACLSLNECIVHGTASYESRPLQAGDIFSIDIGVTANGWIGDAAWTYAIKERSPEAETLMECGKESLRRGVERLRPGKPYIDWARAVQSCVEQEKGFHCVRGLGGHGIGRSLHTPPFIANVVPTYPGEWPEAFTKAQPGVLVAVEPMIAIGTGSTEQAPGEWPIFTADGSLSVHYEADVLITEDGPDNLTEGLFELPDVIG